MYKYNNKLIIIILIDNSYCLLSVIQYTLKNILLILIDISHQSNSYGDKWTFEERKQININWYCKYTSI